MTKQEFVDAVAGKSGLSKRDAGAAVDAFLETVEETLDNLYRRARALLFPSHYEGWGLPVREAAVRGCPVAAGGARWSGASPG